MRLGHTYGRILRRSIAKLRLSYSEIHCIAWNRNMITLRGKERYWDISNRMSLMWWKRAEDRNVYILLEFDGIFIDSGFQPSVWKDNKFNPQTISPLTRPSIIACGTRVIWLTKHSENIRYEEKTFPLQTPWSPFLGCSSMPKTPLKIMSVL